MRFEYLVQLQSYGFSVQPMIASPLRDVFTVRLYPYDLDDYFVGLSHDLDTLCKPPESFPLCLSTVFMYCDQQYDPWVENFFFMSMQLEVIYYICKLHDVLSKGYVLLHGLGKVHTQLNFHWLFLATSIGILSICWGYLKRLVFIFYFNKNIKKKSFQQHKTVFDNTPSHYHSRPFPCGGHGQHVFSFEAIMPHIVEQPNNLQICGFKFVDHVDSTGRVAYPVDQNFVHANIPLQDILPHLSLRMGHKIARLHHIKVGSHVAKSDFNHYIDGHNCVSCSLYSSVFRIVELKTVKDKNYRRLVRAKLNIDKSAAFLDNVNDVINNNCKKYEDSGKKKFFDNEDNFLSPKVLNELSDLDPIFKPVDFPPSPVDNNLSQKIITEFCASSSPSMLDESGCAVCGKLYPLKQLTRLKAIKNLLGILHTSGVTRIERLSSEQSIREFKGPVLDYRCNRVCDDCRQQLRKGKVPRYALANGLWLGTVPQELSCLSFVERLLIARVRINSCFVRVASSGLRKMASHVIAFETPMPKIYQRLPPPMEDLDEVLAVLFTGPCKPTEKEYQRTPLLVRRKQVASALEWLKLNHTDYVDLDIAYDELARYPEQSPPVSVQYQYSLENKTEEGTSIFDNALEDGVDQGDCPFVVHGLTGEQYNTKTINALKGLALRHWNNNGGALAVSHDSSAQSIYNNPSLYPQIFPWLFPYGLGGIGGTSLSNKAHKRHLLMYHDKRFQKDICFPFVAFSHEQVSASTTGGFLVAEKANFSSIAERLLSVNQDVLENIAKRMSKGETVKPYTEDEKQCFQLIRDLDHVDGKVSGSITSKKFMRNEIWSMIAYMGAPFWYITLSPADNKHPICLYFSNDKEKLDVQLTLSEDERYRLIANNPAAGAHFFHFMVENFIKHVLGVGSTHRGLYGDTAGYYGTVEQQGRLTLHLHMLLWIRGSLSPDEIRSRILKPDSDFRHKLVDYLEGSHSGDFMTGDKESVETAVELISQTTEYKNPTETLPEPPPLSSSCPNSPCENSSCIKCSSLSRWWLKFKSTVDDILLKSNVHKCSSNRNKDGSQNKARPYRGCLDNIWGKCKARFPRPVYTNTEIDDETGNINLKKKESWLNTFTYVVTYLFRCNTDITSLRSGTAIKAVLLYVSNYVTKPALKTHVIFDTVRSMFQRHTEMIGGDDSRNDKARKLMTKIVNSLSAKMEMGSPMACMYLLGNPDHYTNHLFSPFYWQAFVNEARSPWSQTTGNSKSVNINNDYEYDTEKQPLEKITILKRNGRVVGLSPVHDYVFRPVELVNLSLYDWISKYQREKITQRKIKVVHLDDNSDVGIESDDVSVSLQEQQDDKRQRKTKSTLLSFLKEHPLAETHGARKLKRIRIPNFVGQTLPRCDQGDREYYCSVMLTFFKPWRTGLDLKDKEISWDETFLSHTFSPRHKDLMKNMNIRYECLDSQDDFHAQMKKGVTSIPGLWPDLGHELLQDLDQMAVDEVINGQSESSHFFDKFSISPVMGKRNKARIDLMTDIRRMLSALHWTVQEPSLLPDELNINPDSITVEQTANQWKSTVSNKRMEILEERARHMPSQANNSALCSSSFIPNDVRVVDKSYMSHSFICKEWQTTIKLISEQFKLNEEQDRAFHIVVNHACSRDSGQLKMYIAGMAGTGKTQVLKALVEFFALKKESHRLIVVAPTGSAAALLKGSTYHSMFGINSEGKKTSNIQIAQVRSRLEGVQYVFLDEVSMLSCYDMYLISARLAQVLNNPDAPFGGMNMIFAGDFAQLPPVIGHEHASLYSRTVGNNAVSLRSQEAAIGKALWHQVITVVILRQNMRQLTQTAEDAKFREALANMRYKACTPADIAFLRSRVSSSLPGRSHVNEKQFRNVSIITTLNSQKDEINRLGSERFAAETKQTLVDFYSIDTVPMDDSEENGGKHNIFRGKRRAVKNGIIPDEIQEVLWEQPPCANTKLIPAKLSLCIGLPIMIRNNTATEMCMTKGQEAIVYGWRSHKSQKNKDILDILFVQLINPPTPIKLDGLPINVVPLTRTSVTTSCRLPDDTSISVSRSQIEALPNFAMTDYASQGKTRPFNVVDLSQCRSHQGYYTSLSRSSTAAGTLILTSFHINKITGGASGALRQEFRELELLDDITKLQFKDKLPRKIAMADRRNLIIDLYRDYRGKNYIPFTTHSAIRWSKSDPFLEWQDCVQESWRLISNDSTVSTVSKLSTSIPETVPVHPAEQLTSGDVSKKVLNLTPTNMQPAEIHSPLKRKCPYLIPKRSRPSIKRVKFQQINDNSGSQQLNIPMGTQWQNNSCAYDAVITILFNIWLDNPITVTESWHEIQCELLDLLMQYFHSHESIVNESAPSRRFSLDQIREFMRQHLASISASFTFGSYASVHCIFEQLLCTQQPVIVSDTICSHGHDTNRQELPTRNAEIVIFGQPNMSLQACIDNFTQSLGSKCRICDSNLLLKSRFVQTPPLLAFDLSNNFTSPHINAELDVISVQYVLRGVVYFANQHFTEHIITGSGMVWYHDGMYTGNSLIYVSQNCTAVSAEGAVMAIYARQA
jgi:PIF1-like helicase/Helitron helicase-like domain at N-terminus